MSCDSVEQDCIRFRSKGKLYLLIKELRAGSLSSRAPALPERLVVGLLNRDLDSRERREWSSCKADSDALVRAPDGSACWEQRPCTRPTATAAVLN